MLVRDGAAGEAKARMGPVTTTGEGGPAAGGEDVDVSEPVTMAPRMKPITTNAISRDLMFILRFGSSFRDAASSPPNDEWSDGVERSETPFAPTIGYVFW